MNKYVLCCAIVLLTLLWLSGCASDPEVQLAELSKNTVVYDEIIRINNCGGKGDSEQTASRQFATTVEFGAGVSAGYQSFVQGNLSAKYSEYRNASKSQRLVAPPGTSMEFVLRWSDDVRAGNVQVNDQSGTYEVRIPVSVEQISGRDLGCGLAVSIPSPLPTSPNTTQAPPGNQPISQPTLIQSVPTTKLLSLNILKQVLDETSSERVEITLGKLREFCNQGIITCYDYPNSNWSIAGPALIGTDPLQQPIVGAQVVKVNRDSTGNWLPNWPIGLFYVPAGKNVLVSTPGVVYPLEDSLPSEWIIR